MGFRDTVYNWFKAGRQKNEPERRTDAYPFPFGNFMSFKGNQPTMKRTPANLRLLSESPIPRRAINVIKDGITQLPWDIVAVNEKDQEKYTAICEQIRATLQKPNPSDSFRLWMEQIVEDMLVASAGASEILPAGDKRRPLRLFPVDAFSIELYPEWDGKRDSYRYAQRDNGKYIHLTDADLMYIRMNPRSNTPFGLSPMETVWESVNAFINAHKFAGREAGNGVNKKMINLGKTADTIAVNAFRAYWVNEVQGRGIMPIIGGEGASTIDLGATTDQMLFLEWQRFLIEIVAISFGVSPKKLGQTKDVNHNTADSEDEDTQDTVRSLAENIAEHINTEIIDARFNMGGLVEFRFTYAASLKDKKVQAEIDDIYLKNGTLIIDEVRDSIGKDPHKNNHGEVITIPGQMQLIDINKTLEQQKEEAAAKQAEKQPEVQTKEDKKKVAARRIYAASDNEQDSGTQDEEKDFILAYLALMLLLKRRGRQAATVDSMLTGWLPTESDRQSLYNMLVKLNQDSWLTAYNRRATETGGTTLDKVPGDVLLKLEQQASETADSVMNTYERELINRAEAEGSDTNPERIKANVSDWLDERANYKAEQIAFLESSVAWNNGMFTHDKAFAQDSLYEVFPKTASCDRCGDIIDSEPYALDDLPASLPLHPNCPHRYYAVNNPDEVVS